MSAATSTARAAEQKGAPAGEPKKLLGERLIESGLISPDQLKIALIEQKRGSKQLGEVLVSLGFVTEETFRDALSEKLGAHSVQLQGLVADRSALALIPKEVARRYQIFPVSLDKESGELHVATADPNDVVALDQLNRELAGRARPVLQLASIGEIQRAIELYYGYELSIDGILQEIETGAVDVNTLNVEQGREYSHPVVRLIDALLTDSVLVGRFGHPLRTRGTVHPHPLSRRWRAAAGARAAPALLAGDAGAAEDPRGDEHCRSRGRRRTGASRRCWPRARSTSAPSVHPTIHRRELRRPHPRPQARPGAAGRARARGRIRWSTLKLMLARPEGLMLITGPTGSGKTTTLYSVLGHKNSEQVNIMTLEDPVEYTLPMVRQTSIASGTKMTFAEGVRSLMRQDPDIVLVGEVRDRDTAEMALRAAMTGHQVLSTLHSNSALRSIPRLLDLGVRPEVLAGNLIGIVAQRLVRKLCTECRVESEPDELEQQLLRLRC